MVGISVEHSTVTPNADTNTKPATEIARQGQVGNRRVSTLERGTLEPIREHIDKSAVATPTSERAVGLLPPEDPAMGPISWFTDRLPDTKRDDMPQDHFPLPFGSKSLADDMKNVVNFAQQIDQDLLRASELLEKSERKPLNDKEQQEVNTLLNAGKYNLSQVQRWTAATRNELEKYPATQEFVTKLQERLADRHMDLADLMCLYDIDQQPPEHAVSRADRIDYNLLAADAALKVIGGLTVIGLSAAAKQQLVEVLENHRAELGQAKAVATGSASDRNSAQVLSKEVWRTSFNLDKGKQTDDNIASLHKHWDAKGAGAAGNWLPLSHPKLTQERMLQEFVGYQLKQAGVTKNNMPDLKFQFKEASIRSMNERPWAPIEKELHYAVEVAGKSQSYTAHSKITPAKAMTGSGNFAENIPANGVCCSDRMQYAHVPNLARTELTDKHGKTLFSALRHGILDAYGISASSLRKLPDQALRTMVKDLLVSHTPLASANTKPEVLNDGESDYATIQRMQPREVPPDVPPSYSEETWEATLGAKEVVSEFLSDPKALPEDETATSSVATSIAEENPYMDMDDMDDMVLGEIDVGDSDSEQRVDQIVDAIRMDKREATQYASEMRTAASENMAKELAVAALIGDADKLKAALDGEVVNINLSSISLVTPDQLRRAGSAKSNEHKMLEHQNAALNTLNSGAATSLQVRDDSGKLRTVEVNCKVRTFNFGVNEGAVGSAKHIPSHLRGWDKLMGWGYSMEQNNPALRTLLGERRSEQLGGEVQDKIATLERINIAQQLDLNLLSTGVSTADGRTAADIPALEREIAATIQNLATLNEAATDAKKIWREGSYNKGGQDPYKMVSRLGMVINEMGETLTFNCKSGKDRTGQLDAEFKYLTALKNATGHLPAPGAPVSSKLRQMRSDFTLGSGNLEMQRMNTGLPGFKLNIKTVPGLANYIAGAEMEPMYFGGSEHIKS